MTATQSRDDRAVKYGRGWDRLVASAVAPGVWSTLLPFPSALSYSCSYSIRVPDGIVVVDLGWDSDAGWSAFQAGLSRAGATLSDIVGVVVTHAHPDHYGLAPRIRETSGAWIAMHPLERDLIAATAEERTARVAELGIWLAECGVPQTYLDDLSDEAAEIAATMVDVEPDVDLVDDMPIPGSDSTLRAIHTPGHTAGSMCVFDRHRNLLLTGDHFLPRVTPNVSKRPRSSEDPLSDFVGSLDRIGRVGSSPMILPGHEWAFDQGDQRIVDLRRHHSKRLNEMERAVAAGASTTWEVATTVSWTRPFAALDSRGQRQAIGETHAHLHHLAERGRIVHKPGTPQRWINV
ncbi:MBL fold metallo-hydrolase [Gordonia sp. Z-3]|uniref:MBL fold metallo-hydrolase n=1 Tax=Gordonia sp. Z-3 TaxID=3115408 RepID=UPI002E281ECD|nr:MBL fold metallo-hydrolase [Gordonia sp. Z-3]MED5803856.1 MBL fold metallo-hydrolase [Gordonia sp. Z-3]